MSKVLFMYLEAGRGRLLFARPRPRARHAAAPRASFATQGRFYRETITAAAAVKKGWAGGELRSKAAREGERRRRKCVVG